jgi:plastocyanin
VNRVRRVMASAVAAVVIAIPFAAATASVSGATTPTQSSGKTKVTVGDNFFKPQEIEVVAGTKVVWTNKGKILHNVVPDKGKAFGTKRISAGSSYSYKFKKPGEYPYYCSFHGAPGSGQYGTIVVQP